MTTNTHTNTNTETALRVLELVRDADTGPAIDEVIHPDYVNHRMNVHGRDGFRQLIRMIHTTFAELSNSPVDVIAEGDRVVARTQFSGLHVGDFQGVAATNRTVESQQIHVWRMKDGLVIEHWPQLDDAALLRQMDAI